MLNNNKILFKNNTENLIDFYNELSNKSEVQKNEFGNLNYIYSTSWPNLIYPKNANIELKLNDIIYSLNNINDKYPSPTLILPEYMTKNISIKELKAISLYPVNVWFSIYKEVKNIIPIDNNNIIIKQIDSEHEILKWQEINSEYLFICKNDHSLPFTSLIKYSNFIFLLVYFNNEAIATSLIYNNINSTGLYLMSIKKQFRGKGIASLIMNTMNNICYNSNKSIVYGQSSKMGLPIYLKMGYKQNGIFNLFYKIK